MCLQRNKDFRIFVAVFSPHMAHQQSRDIRFEQIRIIAIAFVIGVHCMFLLQPDGTATMQFFINLTNILLASANGLFFIMSGKFALQKNIEDENLGDFYFKKLMNLVFLKFN